MRQWLTIPLLLLLIATWFIVARTFQPGPHNTIINIDLIHQMSSTTDWCAATNPSTCEEMPFARWVNDLKYRVIHSDGGRREDAAEEGVSSFRALLEATTQITILQDDAATVYSGLARLKSTD